MSDLQRLAAKPERTIVGTMSGTSTDGYDMALTRISGTGASMRVELVASRSVPLPDKLATEIFAFYPPNRVSMRRVLQLGLRLAEQHAAWIAEFVTEQNLSLADVDLIAYHGIALYHGSRDRGRMPGHLEIGDPAVIAERTGCTVVAQLRTRDIAAGGEGAPLSPYADWILFRHELIGRAVQNIGGIANVTGIKPGATLDDLIAFDTGPGNIILDGMVSTWTNGRSRFDRDGEIAATGTVNHELLAELMRTPYLRRPLPKSTGREVFGERFVASLMARSAELGLRFEDALATATAFTVETIAYHYNRFLTPQFRIDEVIIGGGGQHNRTLVRMLRELLGPIPVRMHGEFGIDGDIREAVYWAMLANETVQGRPGNVPAVTGATRPVVLGHIIPGRPRD
jgi:anhydro-N-acetylmuramic acid kinase